jgi:hypothetical protein
MAESQTNAIGTNAIGTNAIGPNAIGPNAIGPNAIGTNAIGPNAIGPNAIGPNAIGPNAIENVYKSWVIFLDYVKVIHEYTINYESSAKYKKGDKDNAYLMLNGYNALTHVFKMGISYTRNPYFALKHLNRSIYYYTQFIDQMDENIMYDLNLSSNSASIFLYKKMSEEIEQYTDDNAATQGSAMEESGILKYDFCKNIENLINIYKILFESMVMEYSPSNITARLNEIMVGASAAGASAAGASAAGTQSAAQESAAALEANFHMVLENVKIFINHFSAINTNNFVYIKTYIQKYKEHSLTIIDLYKKKTEREYETILNEGNANKYIKWLIK